MAFCFGSRQWRGFVVLIWLAAAFADAVARRLPGAENSWAPAALGPLVAALLCSRLRPVRSKARSAPFHAWPAAYASLRTPRGPDEAEEHTRRDSSISERTISAVGHRLPPWLTSLRQVVAPPAGPSPGHGATHIDPTLVNWILKELWPSIRGFAERDLLKGEIEPILHRGVSGNLCFDKVHLGEMPIFVHHMWTLSPDATHAGEGSVTLALDCEYSGREAEISVKFGLGPVEITVGVTRLAIRGVLYVAFRHQTPHLPLVHGMNIYWANPPEIDIEFGSPSGRSSLLPEQLLGQLKDAIGRIVNRVMVLPNRVAVPFTRMAPHARLKHAPPEGVLTLHVLAARCGAGSSTPRNRSGDAAFAAPLPLGGRPLDLDHVLRQQGGESAASGASGARDGNEEEDEEKESDSDLEGGSRHKSSRLYCRFALGAQCWTSASADAVGGSALWDERHRLLVDHRIGQELQVSLHERHTFGDVRLTSRCGFGLCDVLQRSAGESTPVWSLPSAERSTPQVMFSAHWHECTSSADAFEPALGSVLLITFECVRHVPAHFDNMNLVLRAFLVPSGGRPDINAQPAAESFPMPASKVSPIEVAQGFMRRLARRYNDPPAVMQQSQSASLRRTSASFVSDDSDVSGADGASSEINAFTAESHDRLKERLEHLWLHFRTADGAHLGDWAQRDLEACADTLAELLGATLDETPRVKRLVEDLARQRNKGPPAVRGGSMWNRRGSAAAAERNDRQVGPQLQRGVECHWYDQLRVFVDDPRAQDLWLEVIRPRRRAEAEVLGAWRQPLCDLLAAPGMADSATQGRPLRDLGASPASAAPDAASPPPTLFAKLQLLHVMAAAPKAAFATVE